LPSRRWSAEKRVGGNAFHPPKNRVEAQRFERHGSAMAGYPARLHHRTPGWVKSGALFHLRVRAAKEQQPALTSPSLAQDLLASARRHHQLGHWWCELFLLMPDHAHAMVSFPVVPGLAESVRSWKRGTARLQHVHWQENFFDHRLRDTDESAETWRYIRRNPVVKGLCAEEDDWCWWCAPASEEHAG
jgi:REP element-mobilizing transposase RayT